MTDSTQQVQREFIGLRLLWMVGFFLIWHLAEVVLAVVVLLQVGCQLIKGSPDQSLCEFGDSLTQYLAQIARFGTFNSEEKPWPFSDWPTATVATAEARGEQ